MVQSILFTFPAYLIILWAKTFIKTLIIVIQLEVLADLIIDNGLISRFKFIILATFHS